MDYLGMLGLPTGVEWVVLAVIGLLLFGRKLPGIARSLGQSVVEFKKGIKGVKDEVEKASEVSKVEDKTEEKKQVIDIEASSKAASEK